MNYCVDCRHYQAPNMQCARPHEPVMNPVTGKPYGRIPADAQYERESEHRPGNVPDLFADIAGDWLEDFRNHGTVLVVRRPWTLDCDEDTWRLSFRAHAANDIVPWTPDYIARGNDVPDGDGTGYLDAMRKALA